MSFACGKNVEKRLRATEFQEACYLSSWLEWRGVFFCHIPNEGKRSRREGFRMKRMGLKPGACDYLILDSPPLLPNVKGVALELKRQGEKPTENQLEFLSDMERRGWYAFWADGGEKAAKKLEELGYGRRGSPPAPGSGDLK